MKKKKEGRMVGIENVLLVEKKNLKHNLLSLNYLCQ